MDFSWMPEWIPGMTSWAGFAYLLKTKTNHREVDKHISPRLDRLEIKIDKMLDHWNIPKPDSKE